jgi:hypothetical protein
VKFYWEGRHWSEGDDCFEVVIGKGDIGAKEGDIGPKEQFNEDG